MPRLTWNDKLVIERMLKQGYKAPAIARKLGVHHSTVYDETSVDREILDSASWRGVSIRVKKQKYPE